MVRYRCHAALTMIQTSARLLSLLSLLQMRREWTGSELAGRLEIDVRTVRRDVERLRSLGYPIESARGVAGGYRLGAGGEMPPLLLDDAEAVAVAVGLRTAASGSVSGIEEASVRALAKLEQVLPSRLRYRVRSLSAATVPLPAGDGPVVDPGRLTVLAVAIASREQVRFGYQSGDGTASTRLAEPHRLVCAGRRWYLLAYDNDRQDWRIFRIDRIGDLRPTGARTPPRPRHREDAAGRGAGPARRAGGLVTGRGRMPAVGRRRVNLLAPAAAASPARPTR